MQMAVLSDTHDNIWKLDQALPILKSVDLIIHCGDFCSPFMITRLGKGVEGKPVHGVFGNNDGDPRLLTLKALELSNFYLYGQFASLQIDEMRVAINHYPDLARPLASSHQFDIVCYGHDHTAHEEWIGRTLLLNPGELSGINGRSSFAIVETKTRTIRWVDL